jgi:hypothetical protein
MDLAQATPELFAALAKAQAQMHSVAKDGKNKDRNYNYATADSMIAGASKAREGTGLSLFSTWSSEDVVDDSDGGQWVCAIVTLHWVLAHEGGGYIRGTITGHAIGSRGRPPDKAVAAAASYTEGFLERGLMRIDRGGNDTDDVDQRADGGFERGRRAEPPSRRALPPDAADRIRKIHDRVRTLYERGEWNDDAGNRAHAALEALGGSADTLRGWLRTLREKPSDSQDDGPKGVFPDMADDPGPALDLGEEPAPGTDLSPLLILSEAADAPALREACRLWASQLAELPPDVLKTALADAAERVGVDPVELDAALEEGLSR